MNAAVAHPGEETRCPCGADREPRPLFKTPTRHYVQCPVCGLGFRIPRPDPRTAQTFYREQYDESYGRAEGGADRTSVFESVLGHLMSVRRPPGILLDIGCGDGRFLAMCIKEGWTGYGVEVSKGAAERAAAKGIPLLSSTWLSQSEPPIHPQQFDVICLINVLETLPDPIAALRRVRHALAPRGLVVIRVSNGRFHLAARRWVRWVGARYWQAFQSYLYTPKSMRQLLALAGLAPVSLRNSQPSRAPLTAGDRPVRRLIWKMAGLGLYGVAQVVSAVSAGQMLWAPSFEIIAGAEGETR